MGGKGRRRKSKAALVSGGQPEDNAGSHRGKELAAAAAAAAAAATGSGPEKKLHLDKLPSRYPASDAYWRKRGCSVITRFEEAEIERENCRLLNNSIEKLKVWDSKLSEKECIRDVTEYQIHELESLTNQRVDADHIVAFVKELERENEFVKFADYLKKRVDIIQPDSNKFDIFKVLVQKERIHKQYENLEFQDIVNAINGCILDLKIKRGRKGDIERSSMCSPLLKNDHGQSFNPFSDLVKAVRQKEYIMDEDPLKELNIIKIHHPTIYHNYFRQRLLMKNSENEVLVRRVPLDYDKEQVKAAFSVCGEIVDVRVERGGPWANIAYVTFKESEGAKIAPFLMDRASFSVSPIRENRKLATDSELREALKRYNDFRLRNGERY